jgi:hypothetical protein
MPLAVITAAAAGAVRKFAARMSEAKSGMNKRALFR